MIDRTFAKDSERNNVSTLKLCRKHRPRRVRDASRDYGGGAKQARPRIGKVHRATLVFGTPAGPA